MPLLTSRIDVFRQERHKLTVGFEKRDDAIVESVESLHVQRRDRRWQMIAEIDIAQRRKVHGNVWAMGDTAGDDVFKQQAMKLWNAQRVEPVETATVVID